MMQIDLKKLSLWHIDAAGGALCVVLTLALYLIGLGPLRQQQEDLKVRRGELEVQQLKAARLASTRIAVGEQLARVQESITEVTLELLPVSQINRRIADISDLAAKAGLKIDDIQPGEPLSAARYEMVPIQLAGKGSYRTCLSFLRQLRQTLPDTGVSSLELGGDPSTRGGIGDFRFSLLWYAAPRKSV